MNEVGSGLSELSGVDVCSFGVQGFLVSLGRQADQNSRTSAGFQV